MPLDKFDDQALWNGTCGIHHHQLLDCLPTSLRPCTVKLVDYALATRRSDVGFLQEVERMSRLSAAEPRQQPARAVAAPVVLPPRLRKLQNLARAKRIDLHFMPPGMRRHDSNTSTARLAYAWTAVLPCVACSLRPLLMRLGCCRLLGASCI